MNIEIYDCSVCLFRFHYYIARPVSSFGPIRLLNSSEYKFEFFDPVYVIHTTTENSGGSLTTDTGNLQKPFHGRMIRNNFSKKYTNSIYVCVTY